MRIVPSKSKKVFFICFLLIQEYIITMASCMWSLFKHTYLFDPWAYHTCTLLIPCCTFFFTFYVTWDTSVMVSCNSARENIRQLIDRLLLQSCHVRFSRDLKFYKDRSPSGKIGIIWKKRQQGNWTIYRRAASVILFTTIYLGTKKHES